MTKVLCHGVFDILHAGHLNYFKAAKKYGDYLIVSITTDKYVNKGPNRPYFTASLRAEMVKALGIVDQVVISDHVSAVNVIEEIKPDFYVKGQDYVDFSKDLSGQILLEKDAVEKHGGKLVFTNEDTFSSSTIINKFFSPWTDEQKQTIDTVKRAGGMAAIEAALLQMSKLKILVIGEPIYDIYTYVEPDGLSSKYPAVSARRKETEDYLGGSWAIQNHLKEFVGLVDLISGGENYRGGYSTMPIKTRFIAKGTNQRVFELTDIDEKVWNHGDVIKDLLNKSQDCDIVIAADFGHGLFNGAVLKALSCVETCLTLNVQTNSSNYGYNLFTRHKAFDYLCIDTREIRLAHSQKNADPIELLKKVDCLNKSVTLGSNGSCLLVDNKEYRSPAFSDVVIDATGAGDAYFAITSCLLKTNCPIEIIPFLGNVFAGLKTKIIGNKRAVTKAELVKACRGILA